VSGKPRTARAARLVAVILLASALPTSASAEVRSFAPARKHQRTFVFELHRVRADEIADAYLRAGARRQALPSARVRAAARRGILRVHVKRRLLRNLRSRRARRLRLVVVISKPRGGESQPRRLPSPAPLGSASDPQPGFPLRAAFYYPWFPETWTKGSSPFTRYDPTLGLYDSESPAVIRSHIAALRYGRMGAAISSWWGPGHRTDRRFGTILSVTDADSSPFRWSLYYENESLGDPDPATLRSDLAYIRDRYGGDPAFLRVHGRFVVFVYADGGDACGMAQRWRQANAGIGAYVVLKVFSGYRSCPDQPDGWHQYSPAKAADNQSGHSYSISPGFFKADEAAPRLERDPVRWDANVRDMVASNAPFQLVVSFNEWGEGTAVEGAAQWASASGFGAYLDALHRDGRP
jgi:hypothetical protein